MVASHIDIGSRICLKGWFGTIKFLGKFKENPDKIWLGIEWDASGRGKHSGNYNGRQIFKCKPSHGSFIGLSSINCLSRYSFLEALNNKYKESGNLNDFLSVGGRQVETVGYAQAKKFFSRIDKLTTIDLENQSIDRAEFLQN